MWRRVAGPAALGLCGCLHSAWGEVAPNVALNHPYSLVPSPTYALCTDDADLTDLTDGKRTDPAKQMWIQKGCVGWKVPLDGDAEIIIDLGDVQPIGAITVTTGAAPQAEVYLPSLTVGVSDDGEDFRLIRRVSMGGKRQLLRATVRADDLRTRGRYVLVRLTAIGVFAFCDEVEVLRGEHDPQAVQLPAERIARLEVPRKLTGLQRRLLSDLDTLEQRFGNGAAARRSEVAAMRIRVDGTAGTDKGTIQSLEGAVRELQRKAAQALHPHPRLARWDVSPWGDVSAGDLPPQADDLREVRIVAGQNEYESSAFMLTNLSAEAKTVSLELAGDLGDSAWGGSVKLRHAVFVPTREGGLPADALPLLDHPLELPPWESRQVWVQVHTGEAKPGEYRGAIVVKDGKDTHDVNVVVEVLPVRIPDDLPLVTYSWHYVDTWPALKGIEEAAVADLAAHYTNVNILTNRLLPWPEVDDEGNIVGELDFSQLDGLLNTCRPISTKGTMWFLGMRFKKNGLREFEDFSPEWSRAFSQWLVRFTEHLKSLGMDYDDFFLYPYDEYVRQDLVKIGKLIRETDPKLRVFANPMLRDSDDMLRAAAPYVDVWCPMLSGAERRPWQMDVIHKTGKTVWSYSVFHGKQDHPYSGLRLTLWKAFKHGARGCGFWCYAQGGSWTDDKLWDDFNGRGSDYSVIYTLNGAPPDVSRAEPIIPSKRWEAWREGVEDYVYLDMLREAAEVAGGPKAEEARELLRRLVANVLGNVEDTQLADGARREVLSALVRLRD